MIGSVCQDNVSPAIRAAFTQAHIIIALMHIRLMSASRVLHKSN
jgi:hypothetical protein